MLAATIPADAPDSDTTVWYATGLGWWQAEGGTLASGRISGDPDGHGTPSTGAEEQVRLSPPPAKNKNSEPPLSSADFGSFPTDFRGLTGFLCGAQSALEPSPATPIAARAQERAELRTESVRALAEDRANVRNPKLWRLVERISWLEHELEHPGCDGMHYAVHVGPDPGRNQTVAVHIPVEVVQERIRVALTDMRQELERATARVRLMANIEAQRVAIDALLRRD